MPRRRAKGDFADRRVSIQAAVKAVSCGQSMRHAAKEFGVPYSTLQDHCSGELKIVIYRQNLLQP